MSGIDRFVYRIPNAVYIPIATGAGRGKGDPQLAGGSPQAERTAFRSKGHFQGQGAQGSYRANTADRKGNIRKAG